MGRQRIHYYWKFAITVTYELAKYIQAMFVNLAILYTFSSKLQKAEIVMDSSIHYNKNKSRNKKVCEGFSLLGSFISLPDLGKW